MTEQKYKDVIQRNKNRLLEEERLIEAQIADEMIEMEQQLQAFENMIVKHKVI